MRRVLDVENSITLRDGKIYNDPYEEANTLTEVGVLCLDSGMKRLLPFDHNEATEKDKMNSCVLQRLLGSTTLLIGHNLQYDLQWLWANGFEYDGEIYDTMLAEYLLMRGQKQPLSLEQCAIRRGLKYQKDDTLKTYYKKGYNTNEIPLDELSHYLEHDLLTTGELYYATDRDFKTPASASLQSVQGVTFRTCKALARMSRSGIRVDTDALEHVRHDYERERNEILERLHSRTRALMGGTPINLNSPEQLSWVIFSRKPNDKKEWAELFDFVDPPDFKDAVKKNSTLMLKTNVKTCPECDGTGKVYKIRKDGTRYARPNKCPKCGGRGYLLINTNEMAGLGFFPPSKKWISANGFGVGKKNLDTLIATAKNNYMEKAIGFLQDVKRLSAISSYLSSFVDGIYSNTKRDRVLHINLTQTNTNTGRFSGRKPNMQNMPRGGTFPIKRVFISRWDGGKIIEADFAQLEFRTAAFLAQDSTAMREIDTGFDVHSYTAKVISDAGQPTTRQQAKEHTFAPLFGATGYGRSKAEAAYYKQFVEKYKGIAKWHKKLGDEAVNEGKITNVSGRQYAFPDVVRRENGSVSHFTMIKNYPVQGFATGDVVPVVLLELDRLLQPMQSCLVNSVHDSVVIDTHPDEINDVLSIIDLLNDNLNDIIQKEYDIEMNVPLLLESKIGDNWLDIKDV
tara:strand:- start:4321 stop:6363 length:2043 start_codon:yes stop_codon:yes gene_type:complete